MKNLILVLLGLFLITSCEMKEEVFISETGNVNYGLYIDFTEMSQIEPLTSETDPDFPMDTILTAKQMITFKKDKKSMGPNLKNDASYELFKDFNFHIKMNENESSIRVFLPERSITDFNTYMVEYDKKMQAYMDSLAQKKDLPDSLKKSDLDLPIQSKLRLAYDGKSFERIGQYERIDNLDETSTDGGIEEMFMKFMNYKVVYHFPKPIKSVSDSTALMSVDRKTIYLEKPMRILEEDPYAYNFKVTFE